MLFFTIFSYFLAAGCCTVFSKIFQIIFRLLSLLFFLFSVYYIIIPAQMLFYNLYTNLNSGIYLDAEKIASSFRFRYRTFAPVGSEGYYFRL